MKIVVNFFERGSDVLGNKHIELKEFFNRLNELPSNFSLGIGGQSVSMNPMGLIKEIIKAKVNSIKIVASPVGGLGADLLIGAGVASTIEFAQVSLWEFGMAPNFRQAVQEGSVTCLEHT